MLFIIKIIGKNILNHYFSIFLAFIVGSSDTGSGESVAASTAPVSTKLFVPAMKNNSDNRDIRSVSNVAGDNATNAGTITIQGQ